MINIRKILPSDNVKMAQIIKDTFIEFGLPLQGTTFEDPELKNLFKTYQGNREVFYIIEENSLVVGGGGIKQLKNADASICELQKMYIVPEIRGKGFGKLLFDKCMKAAKDFNYLQCYLESANELEVAIQMYKKNGFRMLEGPIGSTGHGSCGLWMLKELDL